MLFAHAPPDAGDTWRHVTSVLWRRVDSPGFELCHLWSGSRHVVLQGAVLNAIDSVPRSVLYQVWCTPDWVTTSATISMQTGAETRSREMRREPDGHWLVDGQAHPGLDGLLDVDLGFTPSTNTLPVRRLSLPEGDAADVTAAWLRFPALTVEPLPQRYTHASPRLFRYESAGGAFRASIEVDEHGLVTGYEGLFERVAHAP